MDSPVSRRAFASIASVAALGAASSPVVVLDNFPTQPPELALELVTVAHGNLKRLRELVDARPSLAKAAWDWGFGDWETALGAASHMGNREIAEYLIGHGAHPSIFSAAMLGQLEVVKAFVTAQPGVQRIPGPHSISLLAHARAGGSAAASVFAYVESLGDAGAAPPVPLPEGEMAALTGIYVFGPRPIDRFEVAVNRGQLVCTRSGTMGRSLFHLGDHAFYPGGAPAVRIRFAGQNGQMAFTIHDPDLILTAVRTTTKAAAQE